MNNEVVNQINYQFVDVIENVFVDFTFLLSFFFSNFCKCLLFIVSVFFFSFFVIILSITSDFKTSLLSVFVERTTQKIFRAEKIIETNIAFAEIVFDFLQIISSNDIAISNRNAEKKAQNEQISSAKKNSNDVERQHFEAVSSSSSSDVSKSNDQKIDSFVKFSALLIEQRATTLIRV